ncbi:hypothetical protein C809_01939 [Lachnospiraceae bacterium MD335]|nr:hypothetical protein C809_01939 [Lachnospiraceae bacterium MD335]
MATAKKTENSMSDVKNREQMFTKEQIAASQRYADRKDLVNAVLADGKKYTFQDVEKTIENYLKGKVK